MHALIENGAVQRYPYSIEELKRLNPNVSFPVNGNDASLEAFNVFRVYFSTPPENLPRTSVAEEGVPVYDAEAGRWAQTWLVREKTAEELAAEEQGAAAAVRYERNLLIANCDWTQLDDTPITNAKKLEWATYRQALRDIPDQAGFPWEVVWPVEPE
jgi:hypothetical protein